jgi:hypothetical protein
MAYRNAVPALDEAAFRELLDDRGVLRPGALVAPPRDRAFTVFAQRPSAVLEMDALKQQAARFFSAKLGWSVDKRYQGDAPDTDAARIVIATDDGSTSGTRIVFGRPADGADVAAAEEAERTQNTTGMALLAQRCQTVWLVVVESADDRVALTIAAIFASSMLGPILQPDGKEVFGVRTARMKIEGRAAPYR